MAERLLGAQLVAQLQRAARCSIACVIPVASTGSDARSSGDTADSSAARSAAVPARIASTSAR